MSDPASERLLLDLLEVARARNWQIETISGTVGPKNELKVSKFRVRSQETNMKPQARAQILLLQGLLNIDPAECEFISHEVRADGEWVMDVVWVPSQWRFPDGTHPTTDQFVSNRGPLNNQASVGFESVTARWERQHGSYIVSFTHDGSRCSCAWAQTHEDEKTGSTTPCSHQQLAAWVRLRWYDKHNTTEPWPLYGEDQLRKEIARADQEHLGSDQPR